MGDTILIEHPERQKRVWRIFFAVSTAALWAIWTYLWLPVIPYLKYLFSTGTPYQHFIPQSWQALADVLPVYLAVIVTMGGTLITWGLYNYLRFRGVERRRARSGVTVEDLSSEVGLAAYQILDWQAARRLVIEHDERGRLSAGWR